MKIFKGLFYFFLIAVLFSCENEEFAIEDQNSIEENDLTIDFESYRDTSFGVYKGVFSTADSGTRGVVEIQILTNSIPNATITYTNGTVDNLTGTITNDGDQLTVDFISNNATFNFKVAADGSNPLIENVTVNTNPSFIKVLKENTRDAVVPITGSFMTDMSSATVASGTWNIMFDSGDPEDTNMNITTQTIFNGADFGSSTGSSQTNCIAVGNKANCDMVGMYTSQGIDIQWTGIHTFLNENDCSSVIGTWSTSNGLSGTFEGDSDCNGTGEVIITEIHNRPQRPSAEEMTAAIPNNPGSPGNTDLRDDGSGQEQHTEWFEVFNTTDSPVVMDGWVVTDASGSGSFTIGSFTLGAGAYASFTGYDIPAAQGGVSFDYIYTYEEASFNNESSYADAGDSQCPDGLIITKADDVLVDQVLYDYGYGEYLGNASSSTRCRDNDVAIGFPGQMSNSRVSFQLVNNPAVMNAADNDNAANWSFSTNEYDSDNGQDGTPGAPNDM